MQKNLAIFFITCMFALSAAAYATEENQFTINNHFDKPLNFTITINPTTLPDLPKTFTLQQKDSIATKVLNEKEAYIRVVDDNNHSGFFGVNIEKDQVRIHGYLSHGIAFSWAHGIVTFCTPEEYKQKHSC